MFKYQETFLPGFKQHVFNPKKTHDRVATFTFEEGMYIIKHVKQKHLHGVDVEGITDPQSTRIRMIANGQTTCVSCGIKGNHFYIERHKNDKTSLYSLNLYALSEHGERMLTWDHILPRSLGGSNQLINAQCMCDVCNRAKGNQLSMAELIELGTRPDALAMYAVPQFNFKKRKMAETIAAVKAEFDKLINIRLERR